MASKEVLSMLEIRFFKPVLLISNRGIKTKGSIPKQHHIKPESLNIRL
jgi:hypothetical protein